MKYKTLLYDVESISERLPDDCLQIVIQYLKDKQEFTKKYSNISKFILRDCNQNRFLSRYFGKEYVHFGDEVSEYCMRYEYSNYEPMEMLMYIETPRENITYDCNTFRIVDHYRNLKFVFKFV